MVVFALRELNVFRSSNGWTDSIKKVFWYGGIKIEITGKAFLRWGNWLTGGVPNVGKESFESINNFIWVRYDHIVRDEFNRLWGYLRIIGDKRLQKWPDFLNIIFI